MRISDWSSDVCSSDLFADGPDARTTRTSAAAAAALDTINKAAARRATFPLFGTQDKMTSRTCFPDTIHEIGQRCILGVRIGDLFQFGKRRGVASVEPLPQFDERCPQLRVHLRRGLPHFDWSRAAAPPAPTSSERLFGNNCVLPC